MMRRLLCASMTALQYSYMHDQQVPHRSVVAEQHPLHTLFNNFLSNPCCLL